MKGLTYKDAGVDIQQGDRFVSAISPLVKTTFRQEVMMDIGSFGALFSIDVNKYKEPVLVSGTDGVGTKLKIAFMTDKHDTIGIDLVAMCVNDILTLGAEPLFFLDYLAVGRLDVNKSTQIIKGIVDGCKMAGCSLIGGETAEMAGFYKENEYDIAGFAVGIVEKAKIITGENVSDGDIVVGIQSSGLHSNGYSLVRRLFFDELHWDLGRYVSELGTSLGDEILKPTIIYVKPVLEILKLGVVKAMAHITGGGLTGNIPRVVPKNMTILIEKGTWQIPPVFTLIQRLGRVDEDEMYNTFNMGIGFVIICSRQDYPSVSEGLKKSGLKYYLIGQIKKAEGGVRYV
ncbi:MAG: phosphoribosylformylglycinamidine cyclo-ligase [Thermodesulfovibrionales bacterium]|nr:phosphoribosylformylglycinamidine cyclo-ligase [Thermodesulfovibrionales bacterium]